MSFLLIKICKFSVGVCAHVKKKTTTKKEQEALGLQGQNKATGKGRVKMKKKLQRKMDQKGLRTARDGRLGKKKGHEDSATVGSWVLEANYDRIGIPVAFKRPEPDNAEP